MRFIGISIKRRGVSCVFLHFSFSVFLSEYSRVPLFLFLKKNHFHSFPSQVDSFMRCDVCVTLATIQQRVEDLVRLASSNRRKRRVGDYSYTAICHRRRVISKRKAVLYELCGRYKTTRKDMASLKESQKASHKESQNAPIDITIIPVDACVPDEDVEIGRYVEILNNDCGDQTFGITRAGVLRAELMDLDEVSGSLYLDGGLAEDFAQLPEDTNREGASPQRNDVEDVVMPEDGDDGIEQRMGRGESVEVSEGQDAVMRAYEDGDDDRIDSEDINHEMILREERREWMGGEEGEGEEGYGTPAYSGRESVDHPDNNPDDDPDDYDPADHPVTGEVAERARRQKFQASYEMLKAIRTFHNEHVM